jgi:hypothetical protein
LIHVVNQDKTSFVRLLV